MAKRYACFNQKGGVGKSTVGIHTTAAIAEENPDQTVLFIDLDPQGHGTEGCGLKDAWVQDDKPSLYEGLMRPGTINISDLIMEAPHERFFAIPSNFRMMKVEKELTTSRNGEGRLLDLVNELDGAFDVIVVDCPSYFGNLTDNALMAIGIPQDPRSHQLKPELPEHRANGLIVPVQAEQTSVRALELLLSQVEQVETELKVMVNLWMIIPTMVQDSDIARRVLADFHNSLPDKMTPFSLPKRVVIQEAYDCGQSIFTYTPRDAKKLKSVMETRALYRQVAQLLHERSVTNG